MKNVEKKLARLQAQFDTANTATKRLQEKYYKATCDIYLAPNVAYAAEYVTNSNQFITRRERSYYWLKVFDSGYGYQEYRTISKGQWRRINRLEVALLNAFDRENDALYLLQQYKAGLLTLAF